MSRRKYQKSKQVKNINQLENEEFIYIRDKIWHPGWWQSLQYGYLMRCINNGDVWLAEKIRR